MKIHKKPSPIPAQIVMETHSAIGLGVIEAKNLLENASPEYYSRLVEASFSQTKKDNVASSINKLLHDPIEDVKEHKNIIETVEKETEDLLSSYPKKKGFCHLFGHTKKRILKEKYNMEWFTPAEMNPGTAFD